MNSIASSQRFSKNNPCPICGGCYTDKPGHGERCWGMLTTDKNYVICTRSEYAGALSERDDGGFLHLLNGACNCGVEHNQAHATNGYQHTSSAQPIEYSYHDANGHLLYQALRYEPKEFKQRRVANGTWAWNMQDVTYVPYRLPDLLRNPEAVVYIVEGEKDADNLALLSLVATTNIQGAGKWKEEYNQYFKGRHVVILPDNDNVGRNHAQKVFTSLSGIAASVRIATLPGLSEKGDVSDWLAAGGTKEQLEALCKPAKRKFVYASEVQEQPIEWLWKRRIAKGCYTLMVGDPGLGKSSIICKIVSTVTNGGYLPDGNRVEPGGVILMSPEDSASKTIVPRLRAAGANLKKVLLLTEVEDFDSNGEPYMRPVSFPEDAHILEEAIKDVGASLAVIDPVLSMLSGKVDAHKDHAVRLALNRVITVAEKQNCALLGVAHLNKGQNINALYRSSSSIAFIAMARTGLFVVPDPDNETGGVIVNHKNNLASKAISLRYRFQQTTDEIGYVTWEGESSYSESELLHQAPATNNKRSEQTDNIDAILKAHEDALTPEEIHPLLTAQQSLSALKMMLSRKVDNGEIMRAARGKYTYIDNPKYNDNVNDVNNVVNVNSVNNVNSQINNSNINNIDNLQSDKSDRVTPENNSFSFATPASNGHQSARQASSFQVNQVIRYHGKPLTIFLVKPDEILVEDKDRRVTRIEKEFFGEIKA